MGSAGFLIVFATVNAAEARTARQRGSAPWISVLAAAACAGALAALVAKSTAGAVTVLVAMVALSLGIEATFRGLGGRPARAYRCTLERVPRPRGRVPPWRPGQ